MVTEHDARVLDSHGRAQPHLSQVLHAERLSRAELVGKSFTDGADFHTPVLINDGRGHRCLKARLIMFGKHVDRR
ncbi:hypothetical protein BS297_00610 [Rhodococcus erythropolis]|uniref:Uncharacterized protein n=1 Tax=Rhodococcus erythropolis TaxID=1833 RepID=A0A0C2VRV3_RHOER|nr:hypothetical protein CPI83_22935 [Rhodococcus sp. H-CA8f]KAB2587385.1 hypothetical protein BS297_00610 [Rhodococcus erythropolis]KIM17203.1 hypothetical protein QV65_07230 [Rhodococcus erythropolis]ORI22039.1 hypothetical protein BH686_16705 [Rhodococcus erythropolis]